MESDEYISLFLKCLVHLDCDILEYSTEIGLSNLDKPSIDVVASINSCTELNIDFIIFVLNNWLECEDRALTMKIIDSTNVDWLADEESFNQLNYILSFVLRKLSEQHKSDF